MTTTTTARAFPSNFLWGVSTASAQIEGGADSRGVSIWDTLARRPGAIKDGTTLDVTCDHVHRWQEDIALMKGAGFNTYRFSIAWPRVLPQGTGTPDPQGVAFYDRLVDGLLAAGIRPMICLYHWDLPQTLQDQGGWMSRDIAGWFGEYAAHMARALGDRVTDWFSLNEPNVVAIFGHGLADHAPGLNGGAKAILTALHHQNLAQAAAFRALRAERPGLKLGTVLNLQPAMPDTPSPEDVAAAARWDAVWNRVPLDGVLRGSVPDLLAADMADIVKPGDLDTIRQPIDVLGINYYSRMTMRHEPGRPFDVGWGNAKSERWTDMGWPVQPDGLLDVLTDIRDHYGNIPVIISENGVAYADRVEQGQVHDPERITFLREHLEVCHQAIEQGCNLQGYLCWSLLDNFEWNQGLAKRFGLVYVDYDNGQTRIPKDSFAWFSQVARSGVLA